jgi:hypothetical protein
MVINMLITEKVSVCCVGKNRSWIEKLGLQWDYGKFIELSVENLPLTSTAKIEYLCDYCLDENINTVLTKEYTRYIISRKIIPKDCCKKCHNKKAQEVLIKKYGVSNINKLPEVVKKRVDKRRTPLEEIKSLLEELNCTLIKEEYKNNNEKIPYKCNKHPDEVQYIKLGNLRGGHICRFCGIEKTTAKQTGSQSHFWKGGITELNTYLRMNLKDWQAASYKQYNYKCVVTGELENIEIHHIIPFNKILQEAIELTKLTLKSYVKDYSTEELEIFLDAFLHLHNKYPLGIPLRKDIHKEFHNIYGSECNDIEFKEYINNKYGIKIDTTYKYVNINKSKYFTYKVNCSSKYRGVTYVGSAKNNKWKATYMKGKKIIELGYFVSEYEAAECYNKKAIELYGKHAILNKLDPKDKPENYEFHKKYHYIKEGYSSRFQGVNKDKSGFYIARLTYNGNRINIGYYETELEAAYYYNKMVLDINKKFGQELKLNYLKPEEIQTVEKATQKYFEHKEYGDTIYSCIFYKKNKSKPWECYFQDKGIKHYIGAFYSEKESAIAYNDYIIKNNINRKLNRLVDRSNPKDNISNLDIKYHQNKEKGTSRFTGVYKINDKYYKAVLCYNKKNIQIGQYSSELEAAYFYNKKVLEVNKHYKESLKINYLTEQEIEVVEDKLTFYPHNTDLKTIYTCVYYKKGVKKSPWFFKFINNKQKHFMSGFATDKEAAIAYNNYVIKNNLDRKLNKIE